MMIDILWVLVVVVVMPPIAILVVELVNWLFVPFYFTQLICSLTGSDILMPEDTEKARLEPGLKKKAKNLMYHPDKFIGWLTGNHNKNRFMDDHKFLPGNAVRFGNMTLRHYYDGKIIPKKLERMTGQQACLAVMLTPTAKIKEELGLEAEKVIGHNDLLYLVAQAKPDIALNFLLLYMRHRDDLEEEVDRFLMLPETQELKQLLHETSGDKKVEKITDKIVREIRQTCIYCNDLLVEGKIPTALGLMMAACPDDELSDQMVNKIEMEKKEEAKTEQGNMLLLVIGACVGEAMLFVGALIVVIIIMNG